MKRESCLGVALALTIGGSEARATDVSGSQSGTWTPAGSPYFLVGDVVVLPGETLTIQPGVEVIAQGHYKLTVDQSTLLAVGTAQEPITMTAADPGPGWRGIRLEAANNQTTISFCVIEYAKGSGGYPEVRGGALMVKNCSPTISHNLFRFNSSHNASLNGCGGAVCTESSSALILDNTMIDNMADSGGAIATTEYGSPVVHGNHMADNSALNGGGAMYLGARSSPVIEYNTITRNSSVGWGGGGINSWTSFIYFGTYATIRNNVITHNTAGTGGGLYCRYDRAVVTNNVIAFNAATKGGGIHALNYPEQAPVVANCVLWGNTAQVEGPQVDLEESTGSAISVSYCDVQGGWPGPGNIDADPKLVDPDGADDVPGTDDDDLRPAPGSPCIDAGDNDALPEDVNEDLDGGPRFVDDPCTADTGHAGNGGSIVDMGPYEFQDASCDLDHDGTVGIGDLLDLLASWGPCADCDDCPGDFDGDCTVGIGDLLILLANWGSQTAPPMSGPGGRRRRIG
ncbi:MAG: right-handed parallel beta-helix repeat-containing protein [Planctomycetota bacterium]|jgi:hypothetical protein